MYEFIVLAKSTYLQVWTVELDAQEHNHRTYFLSRKRLRYVSSKTTCLSNVVSIKCDQLVACVRRIPWYGLDNI